VARRDGHIYLLGAPPGEDGDDDELAEPLLADAG
jgi:hypothetical protein